LSWSSGKDSAWTLHILRKRADIQVVGLFSTVNEQFDRVAMHAVRVGLLQEQSKAIGLPLHLIRIPHPCSNEIYDEKMAEFIEEARQEHIEYMAFGDLFLSDVRRYREEKLASTGIIPLFPLWGTPTDKLCYDMIRNGLRAKITCLDPKQVPRHLVGSEYDGAFLEGLPEGIDPCGENGEFHSFVFDGPMFNSAVKISVGEAIERDGFVFVDILPGERITNSCS